MYGPTSQSFGVPSPAGTPSYGGQSAQRQQYAAVQQQQAAAAAYAQQQQQRFTAPQGYPAPGQASMRPGYPVAGYQQQLPPPQQQPPPQRSSRPHKGTIPPGQMVRVGQNAVRVERYLSEGGYAHVYLTTSDKPIYPPARGGNGATPKGRWGEKGYTEHCLKRIAFDDDKVWADVSKEIEVMKALPASPYLIQYLDSSHHRLPNGQHEVFILMEFCSGGGIIDLLNKRLSDRLKEIEILNIFTDVCEAVAAMHALPRPLLHRDLKIENVLSHPNGQPPTAQRPTPLIFKLCDFGSTTFPASHPPTTKAEADALAIDLHKHTTLQYRSPEMVEPMLGWAVGLPSDVWALGVMLYKLCYYTTPFEEHGTLAIVNAKYTFPQYPVYSPRLQHLIASMLVEHPTRRPSVFEVLKVAHDMSGTTPAVNYPAPSNRNLLPTMSPTKRHSQPASAKHQPSNMLDFTDGAAAAPRPVTMMQPVDVGPSVAPQRRGRPTREPVKSQPPPPHVPAGQPAPRPQLPTGPHKSGAAAGGGGPPPPVLPHKMTVTGEGDKKPSPTRHQHTTSMYGRPPTKVDTDFAKRPTPKTSVDAFGMPGDKSTTTTSPGGFGDSFGAPLKTTSPQNTSSSGGGFGDAFGVSLKSTQSSATSTGPSGFGDSFMARKSTKEYAGLGKGPSQPPPPHLPSRGFSDNFGKPPQHASPTPSAAASITSKAKSPSPVQPSPPLQKTGLSLASLRSTGSHTGTKSPVDHASSIPDGELTFEQRFPSIESLSGSTANAVSPPKASPPPIAAATVRPTGAHRRPSLAIANLTGGDLAAPNRSPKVTTQFPPQPRSTHVTGTAFKSVPAAGLRVPSPRPDASPSPTADYLDLLEDGGSSPALSPVPKIQEDLMGDEGSESIKVALAPLRPVLSKTPSSGSRFGVSPQPVAGKSLNELQGAALRSNHPPVSSTRPSSNFTSDSWSPLERAPSDSLSNKRTSSTAARPAQSGTRTVELDSSDDDAGPEEAAGSRRRPVSPPRSGRSQPSSGIARRMSAYEPGSISGLPQSRSPAVSPVVSNFAFNVRQPPAAGSRPQSMYVGSTSASASATSPEILSPPLSGRSHSRTPSPGNQERHMRRSSINHIVSRYEKLSAHGPGGDQQRHSPRSPNFPLHDLPANGNGNGIGIGGGAGGGVQRKPSIRAKPPTLAAKPPALASVPASASTATLSSLTSATSTRAVPAVAAKPAVLRKPSGARPLPSAGGGAAAPVPPVAKPDLLRHRPSLGGGLGGAGKHAPSTLPSSSAAPSMPVPVPASGSSAAAVGAAARRRTTAGSESPPPPRGGSTSSGSSPDKQQPVNLLIARWNNKGAAA